MIPKLNRTLLVTTITVTLLFAVAAFGLSSPKMTPASAVVHCGDHLQFYVYKSNNQVAATWQLIENATGSTIDQNGKLTAGNNPGTVYVWVTTSDFGADHPSIAQVTVIP